MEFGDWRRKWIEISERGHLYTVLPKGWAFLGLLRVSLLHIEGNSLNFDRDL